MATEGNDSDPGDEEINEYAELIGIDPIKEPQLMWIARQGITAPLPTDWKPIQTDDGELYFHNNKTNQSLWEHPSDQKFRQMVVEERGKLQAKNQIMTLPSSKPPLGKLAPLAPLAPINRNVPTFAPIQSQQRPLTGIGQKTAPSLTNVSAERPKTSRGHTTENIVTEDPESPKKILGGGSRFLKKADPIDLKKDKPKSTPDSESQTQVLNLDLNPSTTAEKKSLLYASLGLSDDSESDSDDIPTPSIVEKVQPITLVPKQNLETKQQSTVVPVTAIKPPVLVAPVKSPEQFVVMKSATDQTKGAEVEKTTTVPQQNLEPKQQSTVVPVAVKPPVLVAPVKPPDLPDQFVVVKPAIDQTKVAEVEKQEREMSAALQERLSKFKTELQKREQEEKEKIRKEHEMLLQKLRSDHELEKSRLEKDFEQKSLNFQNERQKLYDQQKKEDDDQMIKWRKENEIKLIDLQKQLDQDFDLEHQKLQANQEQRLTELKQDLDQKFEDYKSKLEHETNSMKADQLQRIGSRSLKVEKSCQVTMEQMRNSPAIENHFLDQSLTDLHTELEGMRRDLRDLVGVVKEFKKVEAPPRVRKPHIEKPARIKAQSKKKQRFIKSLDEFLTSCDEDQIKHDPILEKLETEDTIEKARQFINSQNFRTPTAVHSVPQEKFGTKDSIDEMINARLRQVFPESNTLSNLFSKRADRNPMRKSNVETELESLKKWLKNFEKEIK